MKPPGIFLIGLTGGIACGKSAVLEMLADHGAATIDADQVTRELQAPGTDVYYQIVTLFGPEAAEYPDGPLNRAWIAQRVFSDPQELRRLEAIVHPAVRHELGYWLSKLALEHRRSATPATPQVAVVDAIKLLEEGWDAYCDQIWVVTCTPEQQLARLQQHRGMSIEEARRRIAAQPPQEQRVQRAGVVIDNNGTLENTRRQVDAAWASCVATA